MRRSWILAKPMKEFFKERTNRDLRREEKAAMDAIKKGRLDPDDLALTPSYRQDSIWCYD